jgi:hypothetical protein
MEERDAPVTLLQDQTGTRFLVYADKAGAQLNLHFEGDQPWFTQAQLAEIFGVDVRTANDHVQKYLNDGELDDSVIRKFRITAADGKSYQTNHYGLDVAFYVGYRVNSRQGAIFRRWATDLLVQYATKGFVIDDERLKNPDGRPDYFDELLDRIRDIRASEKRMWTRILELAAFCSDYSPVDAEQHEQFFAAIQNAMHWAVTQETAAEVIFRRVDAAKPSAGIVHYRGKAPTLAEAKIAKNYYAEGEISALNLITSLTLEFFESQAEQRRPTTLDQFLGKMRELIKLDGRPLIPDGHKGRVSKAQAHKKASEELALYKERLRKDQEIEGEAALRQIADQTKKAIRRRKKEAS